LPQARWLQLATVAADGTPRIRSLVFRGWADAAVLDLLTDGRSAKMGELSQQPAVELAWLLPKARCQFRLRGSLLTLPTDALSRETQRHWQALTPSGRALWGWPQPGAPLDPRAPFPCELSDELPIPEHFQLLRIGLNQVELLELSDHPHRRRRWCQGDGWREHGLNP
jgi:pyridoxamine 5'-phosphate oxidase